MASFVPHATTKIAVHLLNTVSETSWMVTESFKAAKPFSKGKILQCLFEKLISFGRRCNSYKNLIASMVLQETITLGTSVE